MRADPHYPKDLAVRVVKLHFCHNMTASGSFFQGFLTRERGFRSHQTEINGSKPSLVLLGGYQPICGEIAEWVIPGGTIL
jgi:hypothetical protein